MKLLPLLLFIALPFTTSAEVSNYKYNNLVNDFNDLQVDYSNLVDKYNRMLEVKYKQGECSAYAQKAFAITELLYTNPYTRESGSFLNLKKMNSIFLSITDDRENTMKTSVLIDGLNRLRQWEASAAENIGYARSGIEMATQFIECSDSSENKEVIEGKKDLLTSMIKEINHSQKMVNELYTELVNTYENNTNFNIVLDSNDYNSNSSREIRLYSYIMDTLKKLQLTDETIEVERVSSYGSEDNQCYLSSYIYSKTGKRYNLEIDFQKGVGWSKPSEYKEYMKIDGSNKGVIVSPPDYKPQKELQKIFIDKELREPLAQLFRKLHKACWKKTL